MATVLQASSSQCPVPYTPEEALALMLDLDLSKGQYVDLQHNARRQNASIYPTPCTMLSVAPRTPASQPRST